jgi:CHASE3 domain sensor protein
MTVMIAEVYDALRSAGADEDKARRAAEAVAESRDDMQRLSAEIRSEMQALAAELRSEMQALRSEMQSVRGELTILKWMMGVLIALVIAIFLQLLFA